MPCNLKREHKAGRYQIRILTSDFIHNCLHCGKAISKSFPFGVIESRVVDAAAGVDDGGAVLEDTQSPHRPAQHL